MLPGPQRTAGWGGVRSECTCRLSPTSLRYRRRRRSIADRLGLLPQLPEYGLRDIVVAAPIGRALGKGKLVHVMATGLPGEARRFLNASAGLST